MYGSPAVIPTWESDLWASEGKRVWVTHNTYHSKLKCNEVKRKYSTKRSYWGEGTRTNYLFPLHATPCVFVQGTSQAFLGGVPAH
jgi:hypothetical protein